MKSDHISLVITDSNGHRREVDVSSASRDCGSGQKHVRTLHSHARLETGSHKTDNLHFTEMKTLTKTLLLSGLLGLTSLMPSCQTTTSSVDVASAVTCDKCKTVWVKRPVQSGSSGKGGFYALKDTKTMVCPDCESAIVTFFKTGNLKHSCSHCGGTMTHCTTH